MIDRYSREEIKKIWDLRVKFDYYLQVELAVCEAYAKLGQIPNDALCEIKQKASFTVERIDEIEREVRHDVIAFLTNVNETVGPENAKYIHMGLTSSDVIDTAFALQIKDSSQIILSGLNELISVVRKKAFEHKNTVCMGRSHGVHAEVMTFGFKLLNWLDALERAKKSFEFALNEISVGQISGPVGTYSNLPIEIEELACKELGLKPAKISTQIISRDRHAKFMAELAVISGLIEQFATEIRHLQKTEVREVEEGFGKNQKGSSAMPHKKNPVLCENLCGLSRVVRSNMLTAFENINLWHERDISHSSAERIIFPDSLILVDFMIHRFKNVMENLVVHEDNMLKNTQLYGGVVYSQKVLLKLIEQGMTREEAYRIVQKHALEALNGGDFKSNFEGMDECFDTKDYIKNIDKIFERFCEDQ
ncbi:MAG: adenylosuccinate lyase [Candidatus Gastranaerophilales bacterium]|nr:adenylosuccinate lyase [Candidatus Gastranaerophilales bacterium]MCM1072847.1 adenylosuccinate lyase [Bacteroides sp.]